MSKLLDERMQLDGIAAEQIILDPEVAKCWQLIRSGIRMNLSRVGIEKVLTLLRAKSGVGYDEFSIEIDPEDETRALVIILDDERSCPAVGLIRELERLLESSQRAERNRR
jgi:hypothetical protein